jgi:hypothetical protein
MKVFWAWQADLPGKISRHFVREALEEAIAELRQPKDIEEPAEEARRNDLHLDHDTKGLSGSPEVASEIFRKIAASAVFIADMTPVGKGAERVDAAGRPIAPKPLMNPNVAIELGYALRALGSEKFLMILNESYGGTASLPFDIQHRRHPITYRLPEAAPKAEIEKARKALVGKLVEALEPFVAQTEAAPVKAFSEAAPRIGKGIFFADGEALGFHRIEKQSLVMPFRAVAYLRVIPRTPRIVPLQLFKDNIGRFGAFGLPNGAFILENAYGVAMLSPAGATWNVDSLSQYFQTGEIWGINADILRQGTRPDGPWFYSLPIENLFISALDLYLQFMAGVSQFSPPFRVEAGVVGIKRWKLAHNGMALGSAGHGTMYEDEVVHGAILNKVDKPTQLEFLMVFFEKFNRNTGYARPKGLYGR